MTYKSVIEAKRKPALNPAAKVLGQNSPEVKAEVDKALGSLLSTGNGDFSKEDILNALNSWGKPYLDDLEIELDNAQTVDSEENDDIDDIGDQNNALSPEKQDALERMKRMMNNMELKQVKLLKSLLVKGNDNENN